MQIVLWIFAVLAAIIAAILLLPVKVIIKNDEENVLILRYKFLFKTFGENPDPNDPIVKTLKKAGGVDRLEKAAVQQSIRTEGLQKTVTDSYSTLTDLLKEVWALLNICTVTKLHVTIRCADEEPDQAAIHYGLCVAATHSLLAVLSSFLRIRKRGCKIDIRCAFEECDSVFRYYLVLSVPFFRVLAAFWRVVLAEAKRVGDANQQK